jgi:hypothetical protein
MTKKKRDSSLIATARRSPSFPRSSVGMPSATLRVVCPTSHPRRTQSVTDVIPTRSVGTSLSPLLSPGYQENPVEISEKSRKKPKFIPPDGMKHKFASSPSTTTIRPKTNRLPNTKRPS